MGFFAPRLTSTEAQKIPCAYKKYKAQGVSAPRCVRPATRAKRVWLKNLRILLVVEEFDRPSKVVCVEKNYYTITIEGMWKPGSFLRVNFKGAEARKSVV